LPALSAARSAAKTMACLSNQKQIGVALFAYASDHDGRLPRTFDNRNSYGRTSWGEMLAHGYVPENSWPTAVDVGVQTSVFIDPASSVQLHNGGRNPRYGNYTANRFSNGTGLFGYYARVGNPYNGPSVRLS